MTLKLKCNRCFQAWDGADFTERDEYTRGQLHKSVVCECNELDFWNDETRKAFKDTYEVKE